MAMCRCVDVVDVLVGKKKKKDKGAERSSKKGHVNTLLVKVEEAKTSSGSPACDVKPLTGEVVVPCDIPKNSRCNMRVMNLESPLKTETEEAYEGEDEREDSHSLKRDLSDIDLQAHEAAVSREVRSDRSPATDKETKYSEKSGELVQSGHVSDPGIIGREDFWDSPKLTRSCSNLERRDVLGNTIHQFPDSKSQSFENLQELTAGKVAANLESPRSVMTHCSADRVMLRRHSSSQVLPSGSKRLWWKMFLWSHRNIHRPIPSKSTQVNPGVAATHNPYGYSSDTLEPKHKQSPRNVESPSPRSSNGEYFRKSYSDKNIDHQRRSRFQEESFGFWPQNQWVAFSGGSSSFNRVEEWVHDLEIQQVPPEDNFDNDNVGNIEFPPSPNAGRSMSRTVSQLSHHTDANLSKEILHANSLVQSLNPASTVAHISGVGIKAIPGISHFSSLRSVNLSNNFIVQIVPGLLPKGIHTLNLSRNKISTIEGLRDLTRLRVLDLSYNRISRIGQGLSNCTLIKELYLAGNKISDVQGLHRLLKLTVLDLSFNKITTTKALGELVANYNSLQALNLLGNPVQNNISDEQLRKSVCSLLPKLGYLNKQAIKPQRAREVLTDSVAKAALGDSSRNYNRKSPKRGNHGGPSSSNAHRSSTSVVQKSKSMPKLRTRKH
ncbi:hypothetical protein HN51_018503 [Arachis hypogaea]|uniref:Uncharacterized protein LOC107460873 isoform X1 n=2 Tax=Arachis TaxID=3817 RepID=A0A6P4C0Q1_ARADU|nr:uncharacterized protein LOC107460873 isoform X1 [Arachis duranensis]XP_025613131.1 uncharacterized protein LOC112706181 isoform X1 [Arachis hypogaea]QHO30094.1 Dynein assembly factor 1, axonemal [Arachis hypogaea]RYR41983.1 hypothetical protein Ahy_A08g038440 isoform B [Arachis hypogaea]